MSNDATRALIEQELTAPLATLGLDLEALELSVAGRKSVLRVAVDKDGGVGSDDLTEATKAVSDVLDDSDVMGEQPYTLEVTSRGVDRPLSLPRHWRRNVDRLVSITRTDGTQLVGRIVSADEHDAQVAIESGEQRGSTVTVPLADVAKALVQIEFNRKETH